MKGVGEFPPPPRPPRRLSLPPSFLLPAAVEYVLPSPWEKTVMFLKGLFCRKTAALSGLSDEPMRPKPHR